MASWQNQGSCKGYEFECDENGYTGWYRCVGGELADGRWPEWNHRTNEKRYSEIKNENSKTGD